ncbi:hypothetical protein [Nonomuraea sp. NPDC049709]|uniref:hypothetical protein n=1 Tax=Nonomuraea sp. NPDC049709 TaxID=3154736 RepID=UPI0034372CB7
MKRVVRWILIVGLGLTVLIGIASIPLLSDVWEHRRVCEANFDSVESALVLFDILDTAPAGTAPEGERDRSCTDPDDHHASISRSYRLLGQTVSRQVVEGFYRDLALSKGWKSHSFQGPSCMVMEVEGTEIGLDVWFDPESDDSSYTVSASTWPC